MHDENISSSELNSATFLKKKSVVLWILHFPILVLSPFMFQVQILSECVHGELLLGVVDLGKMGTRNRLDGHARH